MRLGSGESEDQQRGMKTVAWMCIVGLSTIAGSATSQEREATAGEIDDLRRSEQATIEGLKAGDVDAEQGIVEMLTMGGDANWHVGVAAALAVDPEKRSPTLIAGMIEALRRDVEWSTSRYAADLGTASRGEAPSHLARELALTGDPAILPPLAWRAAGVVAAVIYEFGLQAVPHLLNVALSPRATGTEAMNAMLVLASARCCIANPRIAETARGHCRRHSRVDRCTDRVRHRHSETRTRVRQCASGRNRAATDILRFPVFGSTPSTGLTRAGASTP